MREITIPNKLLDLLNVVTSTFTGLQHVRIGCVQIGTNSGKNLDNNNDNQLCCICLIIV